MKHVLIIAIMIFSSVVDAQVIIIEAEDMSIKQCANGRATTDGWTCLGPGKIAENVTFKDGIIDMQVIARGDYAGGAWPIMDVSIGGTVIAAITVDSATWKTFTIEKVTTFAGVHELALTFTNDYYEAPDDRNLHMDKVIIQNTGFIGWVTVAWDANTEPDLAGYIINYGKVSRYDPVVIAGIPNAIKKGCGIPESCTPEEIAKDFGYIHYDGKIQTLTEMCSQGLSQGDCIYDPGFVDPDGVDNIHGTVDDDYRIDPSKIGIGICCDNNVIVSSAIPSCELSEVQEACKKSWEDYCKTPDLACDIDYYPYENQVDVGNVLEYKIEGLTEGVYYIAATAYNDKYPGDRNGKSKFSIELTHVVHKSTQGSEPVNLRWIPKETDNNNNK